MTATFTPYTSLQQMFDIAAAHLLQQQKRATGPDELICVYRAPDGCKCAVGALIPDELYDVGVEGLPAGSVLNKLNARLTPLWSDPHARDLLRRLQYVHDSRSWEPSAWREKLRLLGDDFILNTQVLDQ